MSRKKKKLDKRVAKRNKALKVYRGVAMACKREFEAGNTDICRKYWFKLQDLWEQADRQTKLAMKRFDRENNIP